MALTVTNVNTLTLLNIMNRTASDQTASLQRLSTGNRINRGYDDPAGLLALKGIESELTSVNAAIISDQRTDAMLSVTDSALNEIGSLLDEIQSLAAQSSNEAGLTGSQLSANQTQIDNAIASIDRIIRTTTYNGQKLLDGTLGINVSGGGDLDSIHVYMRDPGSTVTSYVMRTVDIASQAITTGTGYLANAVPTSATTIEVKGTLGTQVIEIAANEALSSISAKINDVASLTGVNASQAGGGTAAIHLHSTDYGSNAFVKVNILEGGAAFNQIDESGRDAVVTVNGQLASADGRQIYFSHAGLNMSFKLNATSNVRDYSTNFTIDTKSGATFQLGVDSSTRVTMGIDGMYSQQLGTGSAGEVLSALKSGGTYSLTADPGKAAEIATAAKQQIATLQGRIGGFQKYQVQTSLNSLNAAKESLTSVKSIIGDVDYAWETSQLSKQNVLMQSAIALLGLANQQSSQVLSLLR
jgi:flagellin